MKELIFLFVFVVLSVAFALAAIITSIICAPRAKSPEKNSTYECGMTLFSDARIQFDVRFFNFAIMFLIFDVESIFLFPFAINFSSLRQFAIVEVLIFISLLLFALGYAIKNDILRWQ